MRRNWRVNSAPVSHTIERAFDAYVLGKLTRHEYCNCAAYLLSAKG